MTQALSKAATPAYDELVRHWNRLHRLGHVQAIASWDRSALMPAKGNEARSLAMAEMDALLHGLRTEPRLLPLLAEAGGEALVDEAQANLAGMRREWRAENALPPALVESLSLASSRCEHGWRTQRTAGDWPGFLANFRDVLGLVREQSMRLADATGLAPYDALLDGYEPGMTSAELDALFDDVLGWLPGLVAQAVAKQQGEGAPPLQPRGPFPVAAQRALGVDVMRLLEFDFDAGRLDESAHPFTGGVPEDIRLTTRYREGDFVPSLMATIHETGHGRYEQCLPRRLLGQPVGRARSMGLHESQSLSFEMQLARSPAFIGRLAPLVRRHFGDDPAYAPENLQRLLVRVAPGRVRVEADEATYPLHVILRYRIEQRLIAGEIEADDIPAQWDDAMQRLLGIDTRGDFAEGCLQDIHWSSGMIGYFPCYTLGAMYAAQWFAAIRREAPDLDSRVASGDLSAALDWLRRHVWEEASRWPTPELVRRASGEPLNAAHFRRHLETRCLR